MNNISKSGGAKGRVFLECSKVSFSWEGGRFLCRQNSWYILYRSKNAVIYDSLGPFGSPPLR